MVGSDDVVLSISLSETHVKLWMILKEKDNSWGIVTTGFKFLPSKLVEHTFYSNTAWTVEIVSYKSCSSSINSF